MRAKASSSLSPIPKNSGALPTPPKLPQPKPTLDTLSPVFPNGTYSMFALVSARPDDHTVSISVGADAATRCALAGPSRSALLLTVTGRAASKETDQHAHTGAVSHPGAHHIAEQL